MIDPLTITDEPTARAHADMIYVGEIDRVRKVTVLVSVAPGVLAFSLKFGGSWLTALLVGSVVLGAGVAIAFDIHRNAWRWWDSLSWDQRKVKASEIIRRQRNFAAKTGA